MACTSPVNDIQSCHFVSKKRTNVESAKENAEKLRTALNVSNLAAGKEDKSSVISKKKRRVVVEEVGIEREINSAFH